MNQIKKVAIIGECMVELRKNEGAVEQGFGGDTLNTAVYLSRLTQSAGVTTSYVTGLGKDPFSAEMLSAWEQEGLNTDMVFLSEKKLPGIYTIQTREDGERSFFYWRNDAAAKYWLRDVQLEVLEAQLCEHQMIYLSGISVAILPEDCLKSLIEVLTKCRAKGVKIAFDNNFRPALWSSIEDAKKVYTEILKITDIAFLTFDDEVLLWGDSEEKQAIERTQGFGVEEIVVKRGADACFVISNGELYTVAANKISNVIDTTAAGDSFSAGYLAKRILGGSEQQSASAGHLVAGTVIQYRGAIIPSSAMPTL